MNCLVDVHLICCQLFANVQQWFNEYPLITSLSLFLKHRWEYTIPKVTVSPYTGRNSFARMKTVREGNVV